MQTRKEYVEVSAFSSLGYRVADHSDSCEESGPTIVKDLIIQRSLKIIKRFSVTDMARAPF